MADTPFSERPPCNPEPRDTKTQDQPAFMFHTPETILIKQLPCQLMGILINTKYWLPTDTLQTSRSTNNHLFYTSSTLTLKFTSKGDRHPDKKQHSTLCLNQVFLSQNSQAACQKWQWGRDGHYSSAMSKTWAPFPTVAAYYLTTVWSVIRENR
jgi:hypothetical protein